MSLFITKINNAQTQIAYNYFESEHVFGFVVSATYDFSILDVLFRDSDDHLLEGISALEEAYLRQNIAAKIGVDEFRNGLVRSISLPDSNRVGSTTASISIEERIKVDDDSVLSQLVHFIPSQQDVEDFSEEFTFSRGENSYSYSRNVSLKYAQDPGNQFLNKAYLFLKNVYLGARPQYGFQVDGISEYGRFDLRLKPLLTEEYNQIEKTVSFSENFESSRIYTENGITYSKEQTHSLSLDEDGYTTKAYSVAINALQEPLEINVNSGVQYSLSALLSENTGVYGHPYAIEKGLNSDGGVASLSVQFSNDPRKNSITSVEYSASKRSSQPFTEYSFQMEVTSAGANKDLAFVLSKNYLAQNINLPYIKIPILFPEITSGQLNEVSRNVSYQPFQRKAGQSAVFTNNPNYDSSTNLILFKNVTVSDQLATSRDSVMGIYGYREIIARNPSKTFGTRSVAVDVVATDLTSGEGFAIRLASGHIPPYPYKWLTKKESSLDVSENRVKANIDFIFFN